MAGKYGSNRTNDEELRIVMVGKTGIGKSATGNTILGHKSFESKFSAKSMTVKCSKDKATVDGEQVAVIDTPGLFDTRYDKEKTSKDMCQCISYASPGPHIFLVIIKLGRYTEEEKQTVQWIQKVFGDAADRYSMVLFTHGDQLGETPIEEFLEDSPELQELVGRCNGQYHVFNNNLKERRQVTELLQKIREIVQKNGGSHYTSEMFQEAEKVIEEEKERLLRKKEEEIQKEKEKIEKEIQERYQKEMQKYNEQLQAERERDRKERERDRKEREAERKEREEERKELENLKEKYERELEEERQKIQSRYENDERDRKERERDRKEREEERKELENLKEKFERELEEERQKIQSKYENDERDRKEREREMKEREEERKELEKIKEKYERELKEEKEKIQSKYEDEARDKAEKSNPLYQMGYHVAEAGKCFGKFVKSLF